MLRRPPTSIELKLEDIVEYSNMRREQESTKEQMDNKSYTPPSWNPAPKNKQQEVFNRIGYVPPTPRDSRDYNT